MSTLSKIKQTETLRFILPVLNQFDVVDDEILIDDIIGVYLGDSDKPEYMNKLLLRYKLSQSASMENVDKLLINLPTFINTYEKEDSKIYVMDINEETYPELLDTFTEGLYSKFDDPYKAQIIRFWGLTELNGEDPISGILYKTDKAKELVYDKLSDTIKKLTAKNEFWPKPDMSKEIL